MLLSSSAVFAKVSEDQDRIGPPLCHFAHLRAQEASDRGQRRYDTSRNQQDIIRERAEDLELISLLGPDLPKSVNSAQVFLKHLKKNWGRVWAVVTVGEER